MRGEKTKYLKNWEKEEHKCVLIEENRGAAAVS